MNGTTRRDLIVLAADQPMKFAVRNLLLRHHSLRLRQVICDVYSHPEHDPGCLLHSHDFLRHFTTMYAHALVMFDRHGSGQDRLARVELEQRVEAHLAQSGWDERAAAIVLDPELEIWVWNDSPHVLSALGWMQRQPTLREWLAAEGLTDSAQTKPVHPKEALRKALAAVGKQPSSSLYGQLARKVGLDRCVDPAFVKFKAVMRRWFGERNPGLC